MCRDIAHLLGLYAPPALLYLQDNIKHSYYGVMLLDYEMLGSFSLQADW
jgi:hypothetical protein